MNLTGAIIHSSDITLPVLRGHIRSFQLDRRKALQSDTPRPALPRRRKLPAEIRDLVGTGRLCVVKGDLEILASDAARHAPGNVLKLELRDITCLICFLSDAVNKGEVMRWNFAALFEPTPQQRQWIQRLERPEPSSPPAKPVATLAVKRTLPPPPVFMRQHIDEQTEFLKQLAESETNS